MGIGANDVANAYATSIASKSLTMKQAVILACIFETAGAVLMGNHVTNTIRKGIADYQCFEDQPEVLMYGCMWVVLSVGLWLFLACFYEMPVSTTHSCVGGMIGMTLVLGGSDCVIWYQKLDTFPYVGGVSGIVISWFLSPIFSGFIASFIFYTIRHLVLRKNFDSKRLNFIYPLLIGSTMTINTFFIIYKGAKGLGLHKTSIEVAIGSAFGIGGLSAIITIPFVPKIKKYVHEKIGKQSQEIEMTTIENAIINNQDILNIQSTTELEKVVSLHKDAEKFDPKTEEVFKYLQIFTAICDSFSHGANEWLTQAFHKNMPKITTNLQIIQPTYTHTLILQVDLQNIGNLRFPFL